MNPRNWIPLPEAGTCLVAVLMRCIAFGRNDLRGRALSRLSRRRGPSFRQGICLQSSSMVQDAIGSFTTLLFSFISSQQAQVVLGLGSRLTHRFSMHRPDE